MAKVIVGYRGSPGTGIGFGATEGQGMYIAKTQELAEFFAGEEGTVTKVWYQEPSNPLVVNHEPLPLMEELPLLDEPVKKKDSLWIRLNKMAVFQTKVRYGAKATTDYDLIAQELTALIKGRGYDAVRILSKGGDWDVLFNPQIVKTEEVD